MMNRVTQNVVEQLRLQQAMHRAGLWKPRTEQPCSDLLRAVTVGGNIVTTRRADAALVRHWFQTTEPRRRDRALRSIAPYLADGEAVLKRYTLHRRRIQTLTTIALVTVTFLAGIVAAALGAAWGGPPVTSAVLVSAVIAAVKVSYAVESLSTLDLAASLAQAQETAETTINRSRSLEPSSSWDALVLATSSAIEDDQPIADEAIDFVEHFVHTYNAQLDTPSLSASQQRLVDRYDTDHDDPDIATVVQSARDQQHRLRQQTTHLSQRRSAVENEAASFIDRINLEQDKLTAAAIRHITSSAAT